MRRRCAPVPPGASDSLDGKKPFRAVTRKIRLYGNADFFPILFSKKPLSVLRSTADMKQWKSPGGNWPQVRLEFRAGYGIMGR
jgi:hypothetical protein